MKNLFFIIGLLILSCNTQKDELIHTQKEIIKKENFLPLRSVVPDSIELSDQVKFIRNEIFARYGREFKSPKYKQFFSKFDWYSPNTRYNDSLLEDQDLRDIKFLISLEDTLKLLNDRELSVVNKIIPLLKKFRYSKIDTSIYSFGYLDSDGVVDTVVTTFGLSKNKIIVKYQWSKNGDTIWSYEHIDPYFWISDSKLFDYEMRTIWITFASSLDKCIFRFNKKSDYTQIGIEFAAKIAHWDEPNISEKVFLDYLNTSVKNIVVYAQQEAGGGNLDFWYEPLNKFLPYYRP